MKYLRRFESLDNISPDDIDEYLIDFIQMGFTTDILVGSSYILDFSKIDRDRDYIGSYEVDSYSKGISNSSLTIELKSNNKSNYKISDLEEAYDMLESFLNGFGLSPNYIMLSSSQNRFGYFENFEHIKRFSLNSLRTPNEINSYNITFGFYKPVKLKMFPSDDTLKDIKKETSMIADLNDIVLEVKDLGLYVSVTADQYIITVCISRLRHLTGFIKTDEELETLRDVLNRIKDYGRMNGYLVDLTWIGRINNMSKQEINKIMDENRFTMYITMYPKKR